MITLRVFILVVINLLYFSAQSEPAPTPDETLRAIVRVSSDVPSDARTAQSLGTQREGSGVVIDSGGLVLTVGYLILEASNAEVLSPEGKPVDADVVAYDHNTGFGLLRAKQPLKVKPLQLGESATLKMRDEVLVASYGGPGSVQGAYVAARREFAGPWEYLLENAIYTTPPHASFGGAALIGRKGRLLGIGSLYLQDVMPEHSPIPGNMFIPIDQLKPILADMISRGRSSGPARPWLGMYTQDFGGRLLVVRITPGGPADQAGVRRGDMVVGVGGEAVKGLADFYRKIWSRGDAGVRVPVNVLQGTRVRNITILSSDRYKYLKLKPRF
ncbi:MAG: PDZ domain-containing protein [Deltaproteobacteria bacterium]|nr:PDZ domain-containing protein [Deltaproteobacteria bacterium]